MKKRFTKKNSKAQVWIETVIYTLIALVMIGLVLAFARPKIQEIQDKTILQQSTEMLRSIDATILTMGTAGNQRLLEIGIKKGELQLNCSSDEIIFEMESSNVYSEPGKIIEDGDIQVLTTKENSQYIVTLALNYSENYDLRFLGLDELKILSKASTAYKLTILNEGKNNEGKIILNMSLS